MIETQLQNGTTKRLSGFKHIPAYQRHNCGRDEWVDFLPCDAFLFSHRTENFERPENIGRFYAFHCYELLIFLEDTDVTFTANQCHTIVAGGSAILVKPHTFRLYDYKKNKKHDHYVLYFRPELFPIAMDAPLFDFLRGEEETVLTVLSGEARAEMFSLLADIENALLDDTEWSATEALLKTAALFLLLSRHRTSHHTATPSLVPAFVHEIKQYIDEHFQDISSVNELAQHFFYSREYITRSFRRYYHISLFDYIIKRKIECACHLLDEGKTVDAAAKGAGFHSTSAFHKVFKKEIGMTPAVFRRQSRLRKQ